MSIRLPFAAIIFNMRFSFFALSPLLWAAGDVMAGKLSATDTVTWGEDNSRTGYSSTHNMDPSVVGSAQFGQLWKANLPGNYRNNLEQIFSQPLLYTLNDGIQYVFIATTQNNVYKLNAKTGAIVASRNLHVPFLTADLDGCVDINPTIGVTATGVIDPSTDTWYLTAKTYVDQSDAVKGRANGRYFFHALDVNTLAEKNGFPKELEGTIARNNPNRMFQGGNAHQRPALLLTGQYVYAGFASHCVQYNFTGWIMGWDKSSGNMVEHFSTQGGPEPNTVKGGGVWMSGGGIATDNKGSMYFATGNGYASQLSTKSVPGRQPPTALEEAAVNMKINDDGTLSVVDFFMPWEKQQLDGADKDLGTSPLELLQTDVFTCPKVKRLGVVTGKSGKTYWLNLDDLGGYQNGPNKLDAVPQVTQNENSVYAGAGVYPLEGGYIYINVIQYQTHVFQFSCNADGNPVFTKVADTPEKNAYILGVGHGTTTSLNGQAGTGLLWITDVQGYNLRVYKAVPQNGALQLIKFANIAGVTKFTRPVFGDGRVYVGTTQGALYCFGSPVNLPLTCTSPNDFGNVLINSTSAVKTIQCKANVATQITGISLDGTNFQLTGQPTLPFSVAAGNNVSFQAVFKPKTPGPLSSDIFLNTTTGGAGYSPTTPVSLKGVGDSQDALLGVNPNTVSFSGVITGQQEGGVTQSILILNQGDSTLTILGWDYSTVSETGPFIQPTNTPDGPSVGPFTFKDLPTSIPGNSQVTISVIFNPSSSGNFAVYVQVRSNGGTKLIDVFGTAGTYPVALLEFQASDGSGTWIPYAHNDPPFAFGNVYEQQTKTLKMRLTNTGDANAGSLSVTVSKPPFGVPGIIGAQNQVDLGEGTNLAAGQSATANLFCSVPKSQVNIDSYSGSATWTLNVGDPSFGKQYINFTCNAVAEQVGPLYANGSAKYRYVGCYKENNPGRQLATQLYGAADNTNDKCIASCAALGYTFAGTEYQRECWCGNVLPVLKTTEADCDFACTGNANETCGGNGYFDDGSYISLFGNGPGGVATPAPGAPAVVLSAGGFDYTACYTEANAGRALSGKTVAASDMTIERCAGNCTGFNYFGAEYGRECYCGNTLGAGSVKTSESDCSTPCAGNSSEICGYGSRLNLYTNRSLSSSSSSSVSSAATSFSSSISSAAASSSFSLSTSLTSVSSSTSLGSSLSSASSSFSSATSSSVTSTPTPTPSGPVAVLSAGVFNYTGCYTEGTNARALSGAATANDSMTVENCAAFCKAYHYMGVEYSRECFCGNSIAAGANPGASGCSMTCGGDASEYCGGTSRLSFYTANGYTPPPTPPAPIIVPGDANFTYLGCYVEPSNSRALSNLVLSKPQVTVELCLSACSQYTYVGLEYSSECWCGNTLATGATQASLETQCSLTCAGNSSEICGAGSRLTMYTRRANVISSSSVVSSTTSSSQASPSASASSSSSTTSGSTSSSVISGSALSSTSSSSSSTTSSTSTSSTSSDLSSFSTTSSSATLVPSSSSSSSTSSASSSSTSSSFNTVSASSSSTSSSFSTISASSSSTSSSSSSSIATSITVSASSSSSSSISSASSSSSLPPSSITSISSSSTSSSISTTSQSSSIISSSSTISSSSSTSASSSAILSAPTPGQTVNSYVYLGCFNETTPRALIGAYKNDTKQTNANCQKLCYGRNFGLAATENGLTCACGNGLQSYSAPVPQKFCNTPCPGNVTEICGGSDDTKYLSVWNSTSATIPPTQVKAVGAYPLKGCYNDTASARALTGPTYTNSTGMTVETCVGFCITKNLNVAGLENGQTCYCDSKLASTVKSAPAAQCNMLCTGNRREFCGAYNQILVYSKDTTSVAADGTPVVVNRDNSAIITPNNTAPA